MWDGKPGIWTPVNIGDKPDEFMKERLNHAATLVAQQLEAHGVHGFVYCSQMYSEFKETFLL